MYYDNNNGGNNGYYRQIKVTHSVLMLETIITEATFFNLDFISQTFTIHQMVKGRGKLSL